MQNKWKIFLDKQKQPPYTSAIEKQCLINQLSINLYTLADKFGALENWDDYFVSTNAAVYLTFTYKPSLHTSGYPVNPDTLRADVS